MKWLNESQQQQELSQQDRPTIIKLLVNCSTRVVAEQIKNDGSKYKNITFKFQWYQESDESSSIDEQHCGDNGGGNGGNSGNSGSSHHHGDNDNGNSEQHLNGSTYQEEEEEDEDDFVVDYEYDDEDWLIIWLIDKTHEATVFWYYRNIYK